MNDVIDAVESWISEQVFWLQVIILLAVLIPLSWLLAGGVDKIVELVVRPHARREVMHSAVHPAGSARLTHPPEPLDPADG